MNALPTRGRTFITKSHTIWHGHLGASKLRTSTFRECSKTTISLKPSADAGWHQFITFLSYKVEWENGQLEKVDRWFASSKTCSVCGWKHHELKLRQREWPCQACGTIHDRDENAALNILNYELPMENREVTPVRDDQPVGSQDRKPCTFRSG